MKGYMNNKELKKLKEDILTLLTDKYALKLLDDIREDDDPMFILLLAYGQAFHKIDDLFMKLGI